ncbi:hypothetical protein [Bordetella holmesii]|uniref:Lipoprotein n=3 Tax=Bordetella holmesii TaxID=35814 RepID=A0ABN0S3U7_9BORD|nr:hypothetical protein [Bordetella holmesii]AHV94468.1 hypothetical protein D560_1786 [Bordetella holmesii ATCC 51541]AIT26447.1 hypothetical protein D558_1777 [Bordetella holmesii 44057]EWM41540.1 hypothetical protein D556_1789 [Bordetella holmesii 41130]EWM47019.1 hypothetical protein D555_1802 [Bordetella holmesii 35009]EWM51188.1 hypothetical protein D557_1041 [Bordetella holmesii 70147]EXF90044.1 hypothetical protein D554_1252 [Bordetella holmesii 30539]EXX96251.1 hypothetical protein 
MLKKLFLMAAFSLLAACSPRYDWRELDVAEGRVRAAFPAKVQTDSRDLVLAGHALRFSLASAQVDGAVFAVGYARLPAALRGRPAAGELGEALRRSLYTNLGVPPPAGGQPDGTLFEIHATDPAREAWLVGKIWVTADMLLEVVATGSRRSLSPEHAQEFLRSAVLLP